MRTMPLPECLGTVVVHRYDTVTCSRDTCPRDLPLDSWFSHHTSFGLPPGTWRRPDSWLSMSLVRTPTPAVPFADRTGDPGRRFHAASSASAWRSARMAS